MNHDDPCVQPLPYHEASEEGHEHQDEYGQQQQHGLHGVIVSSMVVGNGLILDIIAVLLGVELVLLDVE